MKDLLRLSPIIFFYGTQFFMELNFMYSKKGEEKGNNFMKDLLRLSPIIFSSIILNYPQLSSMSLYPPIIQFQGQQMFGIVSTLEPYLTAEYLPQPCY